MVLGAWRDSNGLASPQSSGSLRSSGSSPDGAGHWTSVAGYGEVFTTTELFDVTAARDHFDGTVEAGECRFCAFDARNREHHAQNAGKLF